MFDEVETPIFNLNEFDDVSNISYTSQNNTDNKNKPMNRNKLLNENVRTGHMNTEERESILNICKQFSHIFHLPGDKLTTTPTLKHAIDTKDDIPVSSKLYRYPKVYEEVNTQIQQMLDQKLLDIQSHLTHHQFGLYQKS